MEDMAKSKTKPVTVVLFGATGDLSRRKLLPGMLHLLESGLIPDLQIVGTSLDEHTTESFIEFVHEAVKEFSGNDGDMEACRSSPSGCTGRPAPKAPPACAPRSRRQRASPTGAPACTT